MAATDYSNTNPPNVYGQPEVVKIIGTIDPTTGGSGTLAISEGAVAKQDRSLAVGTTSQQAAPANTSRRKFFIQNLDAAINVHINLGAVATTGLGSIRIAPNSTLELTGSSQALNIIAASGTPSVTIWEF